MKRAFPLIMLFLVIAGVVMAQRRFGGRPRGFGGYGGGESYIPDSARTAREVESHSTGTPVWKNPGGFEKDVFTFTRVRRARSDYGRGGSWATDAPDSDLNFSYRLQQMTSLKVDPDGRFLWLTDKDLGDYPFIYMVEPGSLYLTDPEIEALRKYLLNGGFLMLDDFWGEEEWAGMADVMKKVFPERNFTEIPLEHPIYHCVFEIKSKGQVPNIRLGQSSQYDGVTWERYDAKEVHHRAIFDDKGRMMVIATHNTDNGDGWEREGEDDYYFRTFSEKIAYPLGINIIFYAMTH
ncbi:MAG: DUF4159 domain-containing protein [Verrucomicrobia bacterium]|nr:DUF4159 domain-containing protein [Verrucomicrobiota bacterium]